ncbi:MAG TPA: PAS domain S-box protein [Methylibium sp.]|nr:PAS domain S-box protein [Methylibium sp.]
MTTPFIPAMARLAVDAGALPGLFRGLFGNSLEAVLLGQPDGAVLAANAEACRLFGADEATLAARGRAGLVVPDEPRLAPLLAERARSGAARGLAAMRRMDHSVFEAELSTSLFRDAGGTAYSILVVRDLEPQRRAEQRALASEERLRFALDSARLAEWDVDLRRGLTRRSPLHDRLFGHAEPLADWDYARFLAHVHPDDRARVDDAYRRVLSERADYDIEYRVRAADGVERWLWSKGRCSYGADGRPERMAGIVTDVSARHAAERAAAEDRARLAAVIDSATDAILVTDADGVLLVFNPTAEETFGCPADRALGRPVSHFVTLPAPLHALRHRGNVALEGHRGDGSRFPAEASFSLGSASGRQIMTVILRDVTQQHALLHAREALEEAEAANRAQTDFLAHMSHELRTPLNAVIGLSDLLLIDTTAPLQPQQRRRIETVREAGRHLLAVIGELIDLASAEAGQLRVDPQPTSLFAPLGDAVALVQPIADAAHLHLHAELAPLAELRAQADPLRLRQVVINLLGNAVKYNRPQGDIELRAEQLPDGGVEIVVADTGLGMSDEQLQRLFRPYDRLGREGSRIEGTGLGLSLSRRLVEAMGGRLTVESAVGAGSVFRVWLPGA